MSDLREQLNTRLQQLRATEEEDRRSVTTSVTGELVSDPFSTGSRNLAELRSVENTIATFQLADAQREVADAQRELARVQEIANERAEQAKIQNDEMAFWTRRFMTGFAIANGAGFVALLSFMTNPQSPIGHASEAVPALKYYFQGAMAASAVPGVRVFYLAVERRFPSRSPVEKLWRGLDWVLIGFSGYVFLLATTTVMGTAIGYYQARSGPITTAAVAPSTKNAQSSAVAPPQASAAAPQPAPGLLPSALSDQTACSVDRVG